MAEKAIIFQSPHLLAIAQTGESNGVFITFNEMEMPVNGKRFWGDDLFRKLKISSIGIMAKKPNWYPEEDMIAAVEAIQPFIAGRRVVTYGHSQGGYGAVKYAKALHADAVLSFCPQWSINPDDVAASDPRFHRYYKPNLRNGLKIEEGDVVERTYILFDKNLSADRFNADKIIQFNGVVPVHIPFSGHDTVRLPAESGKSSELMSLFMKGAPDYYADIKRIMRQSRSSSYTYNKHKYKYLVRKNKYSSLEKFSNILPDSLKDRVGIQIEIALAYNQGRHDIFQKLIIDSPFSVLKGIGMVDLWTKCRRLRFLEAELRIAHDIVRYYENDPFARLHAVNTFIEADLYDEAKSELRAIINKFGMERGATHIKVFINKLGMNEADVFA